MILLVSIARALLLVTAVAASLQFPAEPGDWLDYGTLGALVFVVLLWTLAELLARRDRIAAREQETKLLTAALDSQAAASLEVARELASLRTEVAHARRD